MVQWLLLGGQALLVALIYVFVWRTLRNAHKDLLRGGGAGPMAARSIAAQESTIIPVADVHAARRSAGLAEPRLVVAGSDVLRPGVPFTIGGGLTLGRADDNDVVLDEQVVSSHHARIVAPGTVVDAGSTNGTLVNGRVIDGRVALRHGDRLQVGSTVFTFEVTR